VDIFICVCVCVCNVLHFGWAIVFFVSCLTHCFCCCFVVLLLLFFFFLLLFCCETNCEKLLIEINSFTIRIEKREKKMRK